MAPRAELLADDGAGAAGPEFFRSAEFLAAEGVTHTLHISTEAGELLAPLVVRGVPGSDRRDASSPYGYPGFDAPAGSSLEPADVDWGGAELVSIFIRHRLGRPPLTGASERGVVQIADAELPRKSRMSDRQQIRRNERQGLELRVVPGPEVSEPDRAGFVRAYEQSMRRADAAERYFFADDYFETILRYPRSWLFLALESPGEIAAASIVAQSDGMLHYYLSGTADEHLRGSPMKNLVAAIVDLGEQRGLPVNLGGGLAPGDALEEFKRGFANREEPFRTHEIVCDTAAYEQLAAEKETGGYFPAYRAP